MFVLGDLESKAGERGAVGVIDPEPQGSIGLIAQMLQGLGGS